MWRGEARSVAMICGWRLGAIIGQDKRKEKEGRCSDKASERGEGVMLIVIMMSIMTMVVMMRIYNNDNDGDHYDDSHDDYFGDDRCCRALMALIRQKYYSNEHRLTLHAWY